MTDHECIRDGYIELDDGSWANVCYTCYKRMLERRRLREA